MGFIEREYMDEYLRGYDEGFEAGYAKAKAERMPKKGIVGLRPEDFGQKRKRKIKQSPKQKLLTKMTKKKWDKYKKGRGKKTYVEIRGEVSRSQAFKKASKRL